MHSERQGALFRLRILKAFTAVSFANRSRMAPKRCRNKFLRYFPGGFEDQKYIDWERGYKWTAHQRWQEILGQEEHRALIRRGQGMEVAARAVRIESRTNLFFSFEKMAVRDAVKSETGARLFAKVFTSCSIPATNLRPGLPIGARSLPNCPGSRHAF
jgi:hypothetical protein